MGDTISDKEFAELFGDTAKEGEAQELPPQEGEAVDVESLFGQVDPNALEAREVDPPIVSDATPQEPSFINQVANKTAEGVMSIPRMVGSVVDGGLQIIQAANPTSPNFGNLGIDPEKFNSFTDAIEAGITDPNVWATLAEEGAKMAGGTAAAIMSAPAANPLLMSAAYATGSGTVSGLIEGGKNALGQQSKSLTDITSTATANWLTDATFIGIGKALSGIGRIIGSGARIAKDKGAFNRDPLNHLNKALGRAESGELFNELVNLKSQLDTPEFSSALRSVDMKTSQGRLSIASQINDKVKSIKKGVGDSMTAHYIDEVAPIAKSTLDDVFEEYLGNVKYVPDTKTVQSLRKQITPYRKSLYKHLDKGVANAIILKEDTINAAKLSLKGLQAKFLLASKEARATGTISKSNKSKLIDLKNQIEETQKIVNSRIPYKDLGVPDEFLIDGEDLLIPSENLRDMQIGLKDAWNAKRRGASPYTAEQGLEREVFTLLKNNSRDPEALENLNKSYQLALNIEERALSAAPPREPRSGFGAKVGGVLINNKLVTTVRETISDTAPTTYKHLKKYIDLKNSPQVEGFISQHLLGKLANIEHFYEDAGMFTRLKNADLRSKIGTAQVVLNDLMLARDAVVAEFEGALSEKDASGLTAAVDSLASDVRAVSNNYQQKLTMPVSEHPAIDLQTAQQLKFNSSPIIKPIENNEFAEDLITIDGKLLDPIEQKVYIDRVRNTDKLSNSQKSVLINNFNRDKLITPIAKPTAPTQVDLDISSFKLKPSKEVKSSKDIARESEMKNVILNNKNLQQEVMQ